MGDVVVIGDLMVDVVATTTGPLAHGSDTPAEVSSRGGGSAANTAAWLAEAGAPVRLVAAIGDDALGAAAVAELLRSPSVRFAGPSVAGRPTGTCVVLVDAAGERTMLPDRGANDALTAAAVVAALEPPPDWVHLSGYTLLGDGSRAAGLAAIDTARSAGIRWSVDASSAAPLEAVGPSTFLPWIQGASLVFANDDEIAVLGGVDRVRPFVDAVVVKHGPEGASWHAADATWSVPAEPVDLVDTIGAGDAFDAGVIAARVRGGSPQECLRTGAALAARAVSIRGGRPA